MSATEFKKGDAVKVTLEGTVTNIVPFSDDRIELRIEVGDDVYYVSPNAANVEKVEPKYEVFGPGDVVRNRTTDRVYTLARNGWVMHYEWADFISARHDSPMSQFTSKHFERVPVG